MAMLEPITKKCTLPPHLGRSWGLNRATFCINNAFSSTQRADHQHVFIKIWLGVESATLQPVVPLSLA
jgi:hypothetical protein